MADEQARTGEANQTQPNQTDGAAESAGGTSEIYSTERTPWTQIVRREGKEPIVRRLFDIIKRWPASGAKAIGTEAVETARSSREWEGLAIDGRGALRQFPIAKEDGSKPDSPEQAFAWFDEALDLYKRRARAKPIIATGVGRAVGLRMQEGRH